MLATGAGNETLYFTTMRDSGQTDITDSDRAYFVHPSLIHQLYEENATDNWNSVDAYGQRYGNRPEHGNPFAGT